MTVTGLPRWLSRRESACNAEDEGNMGLIPGSERCPVGGHGNPLQSSCLGNPMDRGSWWAMVHGVTKSRTTEVTEHSTERILSRVSLRKTEQENTGRHGAGTRTVEG